MAAPFVLGILGRVLFGGTLRTLFTTGTAAYVANEVTDGAVVDAAQEHVIDPAKDKLFNEVDESLADWLYDNLFVNITDRPTFDEYWEKINPTAFGATLASIKAADVALDKTLGIDLLNNKQVATLAVGYHLVKQMGLVEKAKDYLREAGIFSPASITPPGETTPRRDDRGFADAAARPQGPRVDPETPARSPAPTGMDEPN